MADAAFPAPGRFTPCPRPRAGAKENGMQRAIRRQALQVGGRPSSTKSKATEIDRMQTAAVRLTDNRSAIFVLQSHAT